MYKNHAAISNFEILLPKYSISQEQSLKWITASHTKSESKMKGFSLTSKQAEEFRIEFETKLHKYGCKADAIHTRNHEITDFLHENWEDMLIYRLDDNPAGHSIQKRQEVHRNISDDIFNRFYPTPENPPQDLIHVSCTGYASPSGAQKTVSRNHWENQTNVSHVYHMGCYASLPAVRIAQGFVNNLQGRSDIIHTELCTLHMNPSLHSAEQLVAQSLFSDGMIKYSVSTESDAKKAQKPYLKILSMHEQVIPDSTQFMEWLVTDWGFEFVLAKEIPILVGRRVESYLHTLCQKAGLVNPGEIFENAIFAIHPGGPKIIQSVQRSANVRDDQLSASVDILKKYGNMSSATLPHIWEKICNDSTIPTGTKIFSVAFGPGLTIAGALLEKGN